MWVKIGLIQIGHVRSDEISIKMNLLQKGNTVHCNSYFKKGHFQWICRNKHPENLGSQ